MCRTLLDPKSAAWISTILSYFLVFIVLIFTVFGAFELLLHAVDSTIQTFTRLFVKVHHDAVKEELQKGAHG